MSKVYKFESKISVFNLVDGWHFVAVPTTITDEKYLNSKLKKLHGWKFLPIVVTLGKTKWRTALLPLGKNSTVPNQKFIAIKKIVRKNEGLQHGDKVNISFQIV